MRRIVSSFFLIMMFLASSSFAQVRIREKISITPVPSFQRTASESPISPLFEIDSTSYGPPLYGANVIGEIDGEINVTFTFSTTVRNTPPGGSQYWLQELPPNVFSRIYFTTTLPTGGSGTFSGSFTRYPGFLGLFFRVSVVGLLFPTTVSLNATGDSVTFEYEYNLLPDYVSLSGRIVLSARKVSSEMDHFEIATEPDTIGFREGTILTVTATDAGNNEVPLDPNNILHFSVDSSQYGSWVVNDVDTLATKDLEVTYDVAHRGHVNFIANKINPVIVGPKKLSFSVYKLDDPDKKGLSKVILLEKAIITIQLVHRELKPLGDADNKKVITTTDTTWVIDFSKVKPTTASVKVVDHLNKPVENYPFTLIALTRENSGGHDHKGNRPTGRFIADKETLATVQGSTNIEGKADFRYLSSGMGGVDSMHVQGVSLTDTTSTILVLRMIDLQLLEEGEHYDLVGVTTTHTVNHYGTKNTLDKLKQLADSAYVDSSWILQYNDISLENGGPFDIRSNWNTPHQTHREGKKVDMRPKSTSGKMIDLEWLERKVTRTFKGKILEESKGKPEHHYHLTF